MALDFSRILGGLGQGAKWLASPTPADTPGFYGSSPLQGIGDALRLISSLYRSPEEAAKTEESIEKRRYMNTLQQAQRVSAQRQAQEAEAKEKATQFSERMSTWGAFKDMFDTSHGMIQKRMSVLDPEKLEDKPEIEKLRGMEKELFKQRAQAMKQAGFLQGPMQEDFTSLLTTGRIAGRAAGISEAAATRAKIGELVPGEKGRARAEAKAVGLEPETTTRHITVDGRKFAITERYDPSTDETEILTWQDTETMQQLDPTKMIGTYRQAGLEIKDGKIVGKIPPKLDIKYMPIIGEGIEEKKQALNIYKEAKDNAKESFKTYWSDVGVGEDELPGLKKRMTDKTYRLSRAMFDIRSFSDMRNMMSPEAFNERLKIILKDIGGLRNIAVLNSEGQKYVFAKEGLDKWIDNQVQSVLASMEKIPANLPDAQRKAEIERRQNIALAATLELLSETMDMNNEAYKDILRAPSGGITPAVRGGTAPLEPTITQEESPEFLGGFWKFLNAIDERLGFK